MKHTIALTREEVREARARLQRLDDFLEWSCFLNYGSSCSRARNAFCRFCKKLTEFAEGNVDDIYEAKTAA